MQFYLTPKIVELGRSLDFVPREPPPPGLSQFGWLHAAYSILTLVKLAAGIWVAVALIRSDGKSDPQAARISPNETPSP
jgi:hypothetical protein